MRQVRRIARLCLQAPMQITVRFAASAEARALNQEFRAGDYVPNVLTFAYPPEPVADIVICTPRVRVEAQEQQKPFAAHLTHMLVHGLLHAQGYTHETRRNARHMESLEKTLMARLGWPDPYRDDRSAPETAD